MCDNGQRWGGCAGDEAVRVPATAQWIAKRCKKSVERTEELLPGNERHRPD